MEPNFEVKWSAGDGRKITALDELVKEISVESHIVVAIFEEDPEKLKWITRKLMRVAIPGSFFKNIEFYGINDYGCKSISEELSCDSSVVRLTLWLGKEVGSEGMKHICYHLQKNHNITQLYLHDLSEEGVNIMLSNIENLNLSELSFGGAKISKNVYQFLFLVLKYNQTIKSFGFPTCSDNIPYEWIEDCFQENFTLEKYSYPQITRFVEWFVNRNRICNEMKASKAQGNSIPHNMDLKDIPKLLADLQTSSEELRAMNLMVLGDGRIGKTTLLNTMKRILEEKYQETSNITSTVGIDIDSLQLARGNISVWDFGGQMEYTATHSMFLSVEMAAMFVCFSLEASADEQMRQISFWLDFLNSSLPLPPLTTGKTPKWIIILIGVRADVQYDFSITENSTNIIKAWKLKWDRLPIASTIFSVSALKSLQSVQHLLQYVTIECNRIFDVHAIQIPSTYYQFLFKLKTFAQNNAIVHWQQLYSLFKEDIKQDNTTFKAMLQYCHSIRKIIWLSTGYVFTDPTLAVKIFAKFISPKAVRLMLLKNQTEKVDILDGTEIGSLLKIDTTDNERLLQELELIVHLKICFPLKTADSNEFLYLFPSLSSSAGESKFQFQKHLNVLQTITGIRFITSNNTIFIPRFFYQLLVFLFQTLNINKQDIKLMAENGAIIQCPGLFFGEMLIMLDFYRQSIIVAMSASYFGIEYAISVFNSLVQKEFPQYITSKQEILCETCLQLCFINTQLSVNNIGAFKANQIICSTQQHQKINSLMLSNTPKKEQCTVHNQLEHNIFINYSAKTEGNKSPFSFVEPVGGAVEYLYSLLAVQKTKVGKPIFVFWDKICLNDQNWEQRFTYGLRNSQVILLLISNQVLATIAENAHQQQNNILFEYEAALLYYKCFKVPVFPIFLGEITKDKFIPFHFGHQFLNISHKRDKIAQKFIDDLSVTLPQHKKEFLNSIKQTMNEIFQQEGVFMEERLENKVETNNLIERILLMLEKAPPVSTLSLSSTSLMSSSLSTVSSSHVLISPASVLPSLLVSPPKTFNDNSLSTKSKRSAQGVLIIPSFHLKYTLKNKLGMGAQGIAYCATWNFREVVFKELAVQHLLTDEKHKFMRELEVWRNINHPNAISLYGAVDDSGVLGYVMEYCHNGNLHNHMAAGLVFGPKKTIDFACDIAGILYHLHVSSIVHRDIKSSNVMLDRDFRPKLGDFGLSRMLTTIQASATNMSGTPTHMAPEQFIDGGKHDPMKADVYSFGMLLYELATNKMPFFGLPLVGISKKIEKGERPPILDETPIGMNASEREIWWGIVTKCWSQEPHSRPSMDVVSLRLLNLQNLVSSRIQGFCCKAHKTGQHDYFLSYRVSTESNTVHKLYDALSTTTRKSGEVLKVFLDTKCLPDAEDWQKSFLYGLHNSKILVPIISASGLTHFQKAHEENDNVLLEYEHMLSLLKLHQGNVKVFPLFVDAIPRVSDYPDKRHFSTGKHIQQTLKGILQWQGKIMGNMDEVVSDLLNKLDELESGANTHFTTHKTRTTTDAQNEEEEKEEVFIQVEGESTRDDHIVISPTSTLLILRTVISEQLDDFDFEYKFTQKLRGKISTINLKQETFKTVKDIMEDYSVTVRKI